ncbi:MAG: hypothetical protein ACTSRF_01730 [Candidatus Freyarchaeota archaeon]
MVKIYIIRESDYEQVDQPVFSTGDTYIVDAGDRIWIWLGEKTTVDEKFAGAFISDLIVDRDLAKSILKKTVKETHPVVMYRVSGEEFETLEDVQFIQVPLSKDSLDSEDVFLIDTYDTVYIWQGKNCSVREKVVGGRLARKFDAERVGVQKEVFVEEGDEPEELKRLLGL